MSLNDIHVNDKLKGMNCDELKNRTMRDEPTSQSLCNYMVLSLLVVEMVQDIYDTKIPHPLHVSEKTIDVMYVHCMEVKSNILLTNLDRKIFV